jgi:MFS family permease
VDGQARSRLPFLAVGYAVVVLLAGSNLPTPLYPLYQRAFGLSPLLVTLVYATYAFTVMPCLLVFGPLSDALGRRRLLLGAVALATVAAAVFALASGTAWLFAAQLVEGVAMGALQGTAVAALVETHPRDDRDHASLVGSAATVGGAAIGPLLAGMLARYGPSPRRLPFLVEVALLAVALAVLVVVFPDDSGGRATWTPRRPSVPAPIRRTFALAGMAAFLAWAVASLFLSLIPSYVGETLRTANVALTGGLAATMLGASALVQVGLRRVPSAAAQTAGLALVTAACLALVVVAHVRSLAVMTGAAVLAGLGLGFAFRGSLSDVNAIAPDDRKGDIVATYYLVVYLGTAVPVVGVGILAQATGLLTAVQVFGAVIGAAGVVGLGLMLADGRRADRLAA